MLVVATALARGSISYRSMNSTLSNGLDQVPVEDQTPSEAMPSHTNVRGPDYFNQEA